MKTIINVVNYINSDVDYINNVVEYMDDVVVWRLKKEIGKFFGLVSAHSERPEACFFNN